MKISNAQIDSYVVKIANEKIAGALIFGPSISVATSRFNFIAKKIAPNLSDPFLVSNLTKERFSQQPSCLADEFYSFSMLGGRKLIMVNEPSSQAIQALKDLLKDEKEVAKSDNFILIQAGDLDKSSALRKIAENSNVFAAIACYEDDEKTVRKFIEQQLTRNGLNVDQNTVSYLQENLVNNRQIIALEINKIATYLNGEEISQNALELAIKGQKEVFIDEFIDYFITKNHKKTIKSLDYLLKNDFEMVGIIRFLSNYLQKLYFVKNDLESKKSSLDESILNQKIFFKAQNSFKKHLKLLEKNKIEEILFELQNLEINFKTKSSIILQKSSFLTFIEKKLPTANA